MSNTSWVLYLRLDCLRTVESHLFVCWLDPYPSEQIHIWIFGIQSSNLSSIFVFACCSPYQPLIAHSQYLLYLKSPSPYFLWSVDPSFLTSMRPVHGGSFAASARTTYNGSFARPRQWQRRVAPLLILTSPHFKSDILPEIVWLVSVASLHAFSSLLVSKVLGIKAATGCMHLLCHLGHSRKIWPS